MGKQNKTIALFSGPSGGHLFPALACAEMLKKEHGPVELYLFTSQKTQQLPFHLPSNLFAQIIYLPNFPSPQGISLKSLIFLLKLSFAFVQSFLQLIKIQPDVSVGFGSYSSFPGMLVSHWMGIPTVIHEQNVMPGKANAMLVKKVDCVAVTFDETFATMSLKKRVLTGLPLRAAIVEAARQKAVRDSSKLQILVVGGSQGARKINSTFFESFKILVLEKQKRVAVNHITGETDFESVSKQYETLEVDAKVHRFFEKIEELYSQTDIVISRAGANTLSEIAAFELPAVVIPYPHANAHQKANVDAFVSAGAMLICEEHDLDVNRLATLLKKLIEDDEARDGLKKNLKRFRKIDGSENLANLIIQLIKADK